MSGRNGDALVPSGTGTFEDGSSGPPPILRDLGKTKDASLDQTIDGEFDPGSGRTLAACLMHASRATHMGLAPYDGAANG